MFLTRLTFCFSSLHTLLMKDFSEDCRNKARRHLELYKKQRVRFGGLEGLDTSKW